MTKLKENKTIKIQIRITPTEKNMLEEITLNQEFNISKKVRDLINTEYKNYKNGINSFIIG